MTQVNESNDKNDIIEQAKKILIAEGYKLVEKVALKGVLAHHLSQQEVVDLESKSITGEIGYLTVMDTETSGLEFTNHPLSEVIQISATKIAYDAATLEPIGVVGSYTGLNEPTVPITEATTALTGLTNEMLKGQKFDYDQIASYLGGRSNIIAAHKVEFDRRAVEVSFGERIPEILGQPWVCTLKDIPWPTGSAKLDYLLLVHGYHYQAHQADKDVEALATLIFNAVPLDGGESYFKRAIKAAHTKTYDIYATGAPFDKKDILKAAGYSWNDGANGKPKAWHIMSNEDDKQRQFDWLTSKLNLSGPTVIVETAVERNCAVAPIKLNNGLRM